MARPRTEPAHLPSFPCIQQGATCQLVFIRLNEKSERSAVISAERASADGRPYMTTILVGPGQHFASALLSEFSAISRDLVLVARHHDRLEALAAEARGYGFETVRIVVSDVLDPAFGDRLIAALDGLGPVRAVIFNIKVSPRGSLRDIETDDFSSALSANVSGSLAVLQVMVRTGFPRVPGAAFINTGGGFKDCPDSSRLALSVSKAGLHNLTLATQLELRRYGILVKTLVIDGVVRDEGPIRPRDVAARMRDLVMSRSVVMRVRVEDSTQLTLFDRDDTSVHAV